MQIGQNTVVTVTYSLKSNLPGSAPEFVEETGIGNPLVFLFGGGQLIPEFEKNLSGLVEGNDFSFVIDAENGYGEMDEEAIVEVGNELFKVDGVLDLDILKIGNTVPLVDRDGNQMMAKIIGTADEMVTLDFNHPLAGHTLHFSGKVVEVREATEEEIEHGHSHDDDDMEDH